MPVRQWLRSLQARLLLGTLLALVVALVVAGLVLSGLFRDHVKRQFAQSLTYQLDQVTARLEFGADGQPTLDARTLSDPRWSKPLSGLYWQVDATATRIAVLRSRSLWDVALMQSERDLAADAIHRSESEGPQGARLLLLRRVITAPDGSASPWVVTVAGDLGETQAAVDRFDGVLALSLVALLLLLILVVVAQVRVGLSPLRRLRRDLGDVLAGRSARLQGSFPVEVQPLVDNFNSVLDRNAAVVTRSRTQAGNLAHAIKTPLAILSQAASAGAGGSSGSTEALAQVVREQVELARRQVDWHLKRSRAAASHAMPTLRTPVVPVIDGLVRVMHRVHDARGLHLSVACGDLNLAFAGESQDLQEMLGNVLDNACKWARREVRIEARSVSGDSQQRLQVLVDDDGPGIDPLQRDVVLARGARLDERVPGSGLGLAIVHELIDLYGGAMHLEASPSGGLRVVCELPRGS